MAKHLTRGPTLFTPVQCPPYTNHSYIAVNGESLKLVLMSIKERTTVMQVTVE